MFDNDLAVWFPKLAAARIKVPNTAIVTTDLDLSEESDEWEHAAGITDFILKLDDAAKLVGGYPCFLRTGHFSGKHRFDKTCRISAPADLLSHVREIAVMSDIVDIAGLPTSTWAVREWLTIPGHLTAYEGMPIGREFRFFVKDGGVQCWHPYWPVEAVLEGNPKWTTRPPTESPDNVDFKSFSVRRYVEQYLNVLPSGEEWLLRDIAVRAAKAFPGEYFSLDFAFAFPAATWRPARQTWYAIDMAEGERSFHWPECPHAAAAS